MGKEYIVLVLIGGIFSVVFGIPAIFLITVATEGNIAISFLLLLLLIAIIGIILLTIGIYFIIKHPKSVESSYKNYRFKYGREHVPLEIIGIIFILIFGIPTIFLFPWDRWLDLPIFARLMGFAILSMFLIGIIFLSSGIFLEINQPRKIEISRKQDLSRSEAPVVKPLTTRQTKPRLKGEGMSFQMVLAWALILDLIITAIIMIAVSALMPSPPSILALVIWSTMVFIGIFFACLLLIGVARSY